MWASSFPGNVYSWRRLAAETGGRVVTVDRPVNPENPSKVGAEWNRRILEAIGPRTRIVSMAPLHWTDGTRFDLEAIGARGASGGRRLHYRRHPGGWRRTHGRAGRLALICSLPGPTSGCSVPIRSHSPSWEHALMTASRLKRAGSLAREARISKVW